MIVVANSGTYPELMHLAGGLIESEHGVEYLTPASWAGDSAVGRLARSRLLRRFWIGAQLDRRVLPAPLSARHVVGLARAWEVAFQVALRLTPARRGSVLRRRRAAFERAAARRIERAHARIVVCQSGSALEVFQRANGARRVLGYPTAHHDWVLQVDRDEMRTNPLWARFLYAYESLSSRKEALDRELDLADVILVPSSFAKSTFVGSGVAESKIRVVPLGSSMLGECASTSGGSEDAARSYWGSAHEGSLRVLFVGLVTQRKGMSYLIEALNAVPNAKLLIVGEPVPGVSEMIGPQARVSMRPSMPRRELAQVMRAADVLVLPSLADGFGLVAIEAMSLGTPCIVSDCTLGPDIIESGVNGYVVPSRDAAAIADCLTHLEMDRELGRTMGRAAAKSASSFTWERYKRETSAIISSLVSAR